MSLSVGEGGYEGQGMEGRVDSSSCGGALRLAGEEVRSGEEGAEALHNHHSATTVDGRDLSSTTSSFAYISATRSHAWPKRMRRRESIC